MQSVPLFPGFYKKVGIVLIFISLIAAYLYYFAGKPSFFNIPVFAIVSSYLETRTLVLAQTNILDESAGILLILGLLFIGFSRDKNENEITHRLRYKSMLYSIYITVVLWIISIILIYGWAIFIASTFVF